MLLRYTNAECSDCSPRPADECTGDTVQLMHSAMRHCRTKRNVKSTWCTSATTCIARSTATREHMENGEGEIVSTHAARS